MAHGKSSHNRRTIGHKTKGKGVMFTEQATDRATQKGGSRRGCRERDYLPEKLRSPRGQSLELSDISPTIPPRDKTDI